MKFDVGDKVVCTNNRDSSLLEVGKIYEVSRVEGQAVYVGTLHDGWFDSMFEFVVPKLENEFYSVTFNQIIIIPKYALRYAVLDKEDSVMMGMIDVDIKSKNVLFTLLTAKWWLDEPRMLSLAGIMRQLEG